MYIYIYTYMYIYTWNYSCAFYYIIGILSKWRMLISGFWILENWRPQLPKPCGHNFPDAVTRDSAENPFITGCTAAWDRTCAQNVLKLDHSTQRFTQGDPKPFVHLSIFLLGDWHESVSYLGPPNPSKYLKKTVQKRVVTDTVLYTHELTLILMCRFLWLQTEGLSKRNMKHALGVAQLCQGANIPRAPRSSSGDPNVIPAAMPSHEGDGILDDMVNELNGDPAISLPLGISWNVLPAIKHIIYIYIWYICIYICVCVQLYGF